METEQIVTENNPVKEKFPEPFFAIGPGEIKKSDKLGRYVIASRDIPEGEVIGQDFPLMIAPKYDASILWLNGITKEEINNNNNNNSTLKICLTCFKKCNNLCAFCSWPVCDFKCEKAYLHSNYECNIFREKKVVPMDFEFDFLAVETLRYILLRDRDPGAWGKFMRLEPCLEMRRRDLKLKDCREYVVDFIRNRCGLEETEDLVENVLGNMGINSFAITFDHSRHLSVIFDSVSYFAHSCDPNLDVIWGFHPEPNSKYDQKYFSVKFYAVRDIKAGESLTHSYCVRPKPLDDRQRSMEMFYYFKCDCEKCRVDLFDELLGKLDQDDTNIAQKVERYQFSDDDEDYD